MSQSESTVTGLSPGGCYPSPPTSPRPTTTRNKIFAGKNTETTKLTPKTNGVNRKEAAAAVTEEPAKARPVAPTEPAVSETTEELAAAQERLVLETWKTALSLDEERCGAIKKYSQNNERCTNKVASKKAAGINELIEMLRRPNESPRQIETHLDNLAKLVHCHWHDHPPIRQTRIDEWLAALPGPPRSPTLERQLRNILGPAPSNCTGLTKRDKPKPCGNKVKREDKYFCEETIGKMVQMAKAPPENDDTLDDLVAVLRHHMLCYVHQKYTPTYQDEWKSAVKKFQVACQQEMTGRESENTKAQASNTGKGKTVVTGGGGSYAFTAPPSTPNSRKVSKHPRDYWQEGFDTSPFHILGKNDTMEEDMTPHRWIRTVAEGSLNTDPKRPEKNEVNGGHVYVFKVPGNEGFVKIGFTTREGDDRHKEWEKDCNRKPTAIYLPAKVVPHAHRIERLVHAELMEHRVRIYCKRCQKQHIEWFEVSATMAIASVKKWSLWMAGGPYEEGVTQDDSEWHLKETEKKRLDDVGKFLKDLEEAVETAESGTQTI
ncbi:DNA-binding protein [Metarhizium guizhouense ARSEF 977]|uniref:DNA-binding protein n=1 Tax=Metarhizium guizhouense (strain ARSEF 977) TaxID=1276136 RepID=A0A0B4H822_METGA|nr:DNA-binding protein [Metarhizium guizhouense ARSEF 977]